MKGRHVLLVACLAVAACGEEELDIPEGFEAVTGSERLGWIQQASNSQELATFGYLVYVDDDTGVPLQGVSCSSSAGAAGFQCNAGLPPLTAGRHALRVSAYLDSGGTRHESGRSEPLNVFKIEPPKLFASSTSLEEQPARAPADLTFTTADATVLRAVNVAAGLQDPTDLAFAPDGAVYITERTGRVLLFRDGRLRSEPAVTLTDLAVEGSRGLLAIALDPQFARTGYVYLVYTSGSGFRLVRFRAVGDTLGDRAILLDGIPAAAVRPAASLRFGPDGQLYLGLDDAGDIRRSGDLGSFNGKMLRLNADATTPADQAGASPIYAANVSWPRGFDWDRSGATMWIADAGGQAGQLQVVVSAGDGLRGRRGETIARYSLPDGAIGSGVAFYRGERLPSFAGNLLVAIEEASGEAGILRLVFDPADSQKVVSTERLLRGSIDGARAIGVDQSGTIYFCTRSSLFTLGPD